MSFDNISPVSCTAIYMREVWLAWRNYLQWPMSCWMWMHRNKYFCKDWGRVQVFRDEFKIIWTFSVYIIISVGIFHWNTSPTSHISGELICTAGTGVGRSEVALCHIKDRSVGLDSVCNDRRYLCNHYHTINKEPMTSFWCLPRIIGNAHHFKRKYARILHFRYVSFKLY